MGCEEGGSPPSGGYRWTCPLCGESRLNTSNGETGEANAITALRTHIAASDGAGHGPLNEVPENGPLVLGEHVRQVDRRG